MITEDYVSFEVAKLLKEKGFPQSTFRCHYIIDGNNHYKSFGNRCGFGDYDIIAPTLQMAMKWLREVHNIHIGITPFDIESRVNGSIVRYLPEIYTKPTNGHELRVKELNVQDTYEEACEVAIKYCLINLI